VRKNKPILSSMREVHVLNSMNSWCMLLQKWTKVVPWGAGAYPWLEAESLELPVVEEASKASLLGSPQHRTRNEPALAVLGSVCTSFGRWSRDKKKAGFLKSTQHVTED